MLIDWSQNDRHKTTANVYSLRAKERPTASTPLEWDEVEAAAETGEASALVFTIDDLAQGSPRKATSSPRSSPRCRISPTSPDPRRGDPRHRPGSDRRLRKPRPRLAGRDLAGEEEGDQGEERQDRQGGAEADQAGGFVLFDDRVGRAWWDVGVVESRFEFGVGEEGDAAG